MEPVDAYLRSCAENRGRGVPETSFYGALKALMDAAGAELKPRVVYIINQAGFEGNLPDGGLFPANHAPKPGQEALPFEEGA